MTRAGLCVLALVFVLAGTGHAAGPQALLWRFPEAVERLAVARLAVARQDAPSLLAGAAGRKLYVAAPGKEARLALLPFAAEAVQAGNWRGAAAFFCFGDGRAVVIPSQPVSDAVPLDLPQGLVWRVADLDGDARSDLWGTDGRVLAAALQDGAGGFAAQTLDLPAPPLPRPERREAWRVSASRAAEAVLARSETSWRVWTEGARLMALNETSRQANVYQAGPTGLTLLYEADLSALAQRGDVFLLDLDGDGRDEAVRLRLLAPGEEGAVLPEVVLEAFVLAGGPVRRAASAPALRLRSVHVPGALPLVRAGSGWTFVSLAPRLPASAGEMARLATGGELELSLRVARISAGPAGPEAAFEPGQGRLTLLAATDPRLAEGPYRFAGGARPGLVLCSGGRLGLTTLAGFTELETGRDAVLAGGAEEGEPLLLLFEDGGRTVRGVSW